MWETLRNAWHVPDLRKKLLYTLGMLLLYRLIGVIPVPGIDTAQVASAISGSADLLGMMNMMTGNSFQNMTIMAMGITPYINASIILQLLTIAIPALERLQKEGEEGRKKIAQITRYVTVGLGFITAIGLVSGLGGMIQKNFFSYITVGLSMAAGTALSMWIGERVTQNGIGNGISLLIFAGIISNLFNGVVTGIQNVFLGTYQWYSILLLIIGAVVLIAIVNYFDMGERRVRVQYAKRVVGRKMYGGQSTHIPMKVNSNGVLPLIFAYSFMAFPSTILQFWPKSGIAMWWESNMSYYSWGYLTITALLIIAFTYFYTSISFNPQDISKNLQQNGGMIPGIRQGKQTVDYLTGISRRLTLFSAIFLAILSTVPTLLTLLLGVSVPFGASSLLIAVSVAIETARALESQLVMRNYKGFL